jgi:hypothetical protein
MYVFCLILIGCKKLFFAYLWLFTNFWRMLIAAEASTMGQKFGWHGSCACPIYSLSVFIDLLK